MRLPLLKMKKAHLSIQQLELILSSSHSHTSYTVVKTIFNLPFETSELFLKQYEIEDSSLFLEHVRIIYTLKSLIQVIKYQFLNLLYPLIMLASSSLLLRIFINQFKNILNTMNISIPNSVSLVLLMHYVVLTLFFLTTGFFIWLNQSLYRKVLIISLFKRIKVFKIVNELILITVVLSLSSKHLSLREIHNLISKHSNHVLMRIMSNDLKQIIEEGKTLIVWLEKYSSFPTMTYWVYEQINEGNIPNLVLWSNQLQIGLKQIVLKWKNVLMSCCYALIVLNILAMLTTFKLPYEWIHQL